jgi:hypothetical protein
VRAMATLRERGAINQRVKHGVRRGRGGRDVGSG